MEKRSLFWPFIGYGSPNMFLTFTVQKFEASFIEKNNCINLIFTSTDFIFWENPKLFFTVIRIY